jgi:ribonuclease P protein component
VNKFYRANRLLSKAEYDHVFSKASKWVTSEFIFLYRKNSIGHARLGLAISKKNVAKAHERNRVKRLLRETFRTTTLPSLDIVVLAKRGIEQVQNSVLIPQLNAAWGHFLK